MIRSKRRGCRRSSATLHGAERRSGSSRPIFLCAGDYEVGGADLTKEHRPPAERSLLLIASCGAADCSRLDKTYTSKSAQAEGITQVHK